MRIKLAYTYTPRTWWWFGREEKNVRNHCKSKNQPRWSKINYATNYSHTHTHSLRRVHTINACEYLYMKCLKIATPYKNTSVSPDSHNNSNNLYASTVLLLTLFSSLVLLLLRVCLFFFSIGRKNFCGTIFFEYTGYYYSVHQTNK